VIHPVTKLGLFYSTLKSSLRGIFQKIIMALKTRILKDTHQIPALNVTIALEVGDSKKRRIGGQARTKDTGRVFADMQ
jgi:5-hydroxyisourate hydrolase-like protein (transthyretin family)